MVAVRECPPLPSIDNAFHNKVGQTGVYEETVQVICSPLSVVEYSGNTDMVGRRGHNATSKSRYVPRGLPYTETSYVTTCEISGQWSDTRSCIGEKKPDVLIELCSIRCLGHY